MLFIVVWHPGTEIKDAKNVPDLGSLCKAIQVVLIVYKPAETEVVDKIIKSAINLKIWKPSLTGLLTKI